MPQRGRATAKSAGASEREGQVGFTLDGARPAAEEEFSLSEEDIEAGAEAIQAVQSSNASADLKERVCLTLEAYTISTEQ